MIEGHLIKETVGTKKFLEIIRGYPRESILCTDHTFFRLSEKQRELFTCEQMRDYLLNEIPKLVGIQHNQCYAVFYKYKRNKYIRIIIDVNPCSVTVVTFMILKKIPRVVV